MSYMLAAVLVPIATLVQHCTNNFDHYLTVLLETFEERPELAGLVIALPGFLFWFLFCFRYLRLTVHLVSFWLFYTPTPVPSEPNLHPQDCSIILPTVDPENPDFRECIESCLLNNPGEIVIVTVGRNLAALTNQIVGPYRTAYPNTHIQVHFTAVANKRIQVAHGVGYAKGKVTILLDDHVFWRSPNFLPSVLAPFENENVGAVGTNKRVRRTDTGFNIRSFWNMIGALYLERHNFEIRATNAIDGGVFVISGRTAAYRTDILKQPGFMEAFTHERFFFGIFGPLNADDDNFLTRQVVKQGYDIKIQYSQDALIETTLGTYPKFLSQCLRWVRTTWRSNSASLFTDRTVWTRQPWCVYAVYLTSFFNFALFYDVALVYTLSNIADKAAVYKLLVWIFTTKMVKLTPYFLREPQDLLMLPGYFLFAYFHSLIKLYAGLTFWVTAWGGRNLDAITDDNADGNGHDGDTSAGNGQHPGRLSSGSLTSEPASSTNTSSSDSTPRPSRPRGHVAIASSRGWINTPWGFVVTSNPAVTPANVAESHYMTPIPRPRTTSVPDHISGTPASVAANRNSQSSVPSTNSYVTAFSHVSPPGSMNPLDHGACPIPSYPPPPMLLTPPPTAPRNLDSVPVAQNLASHPQYSLSAIPFNITTANPPTPYRNSKPLPTTSPYPFTLARERHALGIPDYSSKSWRRGKQCLCLHSDGDKLFKTRQCHCLVDDPFSSGQNVVPGRPRF